MFILSLDHAGIISKKGGSCNFISFPDLTVWCRLRFNTHSALRYIVSSGAVPSPKAVHIWTENDSLAWFATIFFVESVHYLSILKQVRNGGLGSRSQVPTFRVHETASNLSQIKCKLPVLSWLCEILQVVRVELARRI